MERLFLFALNAAMYLRHPRQIAKFRKRVGYFPNVAKPARYHEKMLWRKMFDRNPAHFIFCDKLACKEYYRTRHPEVPIVEAVWTGTELDDEAFALLDRGFILKANHGSGFILFPEDYARDPQLAARRSARWMGRAYGKRKFEPAYSRARKALLIEPRIGADGGRPVFDLYIRACMGDIVLVSILSNVKREGARFGYFDEHGARLVAVEPKREDLTLAADFKLPERFDDAVAIAKKVSEGYDYLRVDFLSCGNELFANEITIYPNAGLTRAGADTQNDLNAMTSAKWDIRTSHFMRQKQAWPLESYRRILTDRLSRKA